MTAVRDLVPGVLSRCYCGQSAGMWIEHEGQYVCVHERCLSGLPGVLEELAHLDGAAAVPDKPRGAYARRAVRATQTTVSRLTFAPLGKGSPFHVPGMVEGAPWSVLAETNIGHLMVPCHSNESAARKANRAYRSAWERGFEAAFGGVRAMGGMIVTPTGAVEDEWGAAPVLGTPRWRAVSRASHWTECSRCHRQLWPGCLTGVESGRCMSCMATDEMDDPRVWPDEPPYPGDNALPDHLKKSTKKR